MNKICIKVKRIRVVNFNRFAAIAAVAFIFDQIESKVLHITKVFMAYVKW